MMPSQQNVLGFQQVFYDNFEDCYVKAEAARFPSVELAYFNDELAKSFVADFPAKVEDLAALLSGQQLPSDARPFAQAYAGHQFGHFNPQLGDGRAMILGELLDRNHKLYELDLKGSGPTPFSRGGDGKAALGPMLREVLVSEAMHQLGISSTRSLAVASTGEDVFRNPPQAGAVLARTAASHIRIGTFQYFAAREQNDVLARLVDFCIERHYPHLANSEQPALDLLAACVKAQAKLIAQWMGVGFIHGVMNTDNMLISAETIDYGPCAFMDAYNPDAVYSSIDRRSRYAYSNQAPVAQWNLSRFAETLLPLISQDKEQAIVKATELVQSFVPLHESAFRQTMCCKLGLNELASSDQLDMLIHQWHGLLASQEIDWTLAHWHLGQYLNQDQQQDLFSLFTQPDELTLWLQARSKLSAEDVSDISRHNPIVIPRNHLVEEALDAAAFKNDLQVFKNLLKHLQKPYQWPDDEKYTQAASAEFNDAFVTYCGT